MYIFIVNLVAGNGRGRQIFKQIQTSKLYHDIDSNFYITKYEGHAEEITRDLTSQKLVNLKAIIVIGGDGTLHEVINGLEVLTIPVAFIPGGSGNDFARGLSIKKDPIQILKQVVSGTNTSSYWFGHYLVNGTHRRRFVNSIGFGFDAEIAKKANQSNYKKLLNLLHVGTLSYVIALIQVLFHFKPFSLELEVDGKNRMINKCWMVTIANHAYYGGGMKIIPNATIQPEKFPVLVIHHISKWKILGVFLTVFTGKHIRFKEVELLEASMVKIKTKDSLEYQVDGQTNQCCSCVITKTAPSLQIMGTKE